MENILRLEGDTSFPFIATAVGAATFGALVYAVSSTASTTKKGKKKPPHVFSFVPYLGSAIEMGDDITAFIQKYAKKYQYLTFSLSCLVSTTRPQRLRKGDYCIDYDVNYQDGDEFRSINNVRSVEACRQQCLSDSQCEFYVWEGFSRSKTCHLKASAIWFPEYESGTVSGK